jgi:NEDD4-binding protein 2
MNWYKKLLTSDYQSDIMPPMNKEFIIMRGTSGSGKSYKAKQLAGESGTICSADDFFMEKGDGKYAFDADLLGKAHQQCQERAVEAIKKGLSPVVIDNTNTRLWEMKKLKHIIKLAQSLGYDVRIEEPETDWWKSRNIDEMVSKNSHGVPREAIERMVSRFDENITVDDIINDEK